MQLSKLIKEISILIFAVCMYAMAGRLTIAPSQLIEITAQSLVILTGIYLLPRKLAIFSVLMYLVLGAAGLAVFKDGASGLLSLTGKTGGYLIGFFIVCLVIKLFYHDPDWSKPWYEILLIFCLSTFILLVVGTLWLSYSIGMSNALQHGMVPFLLPGLIKSIFSMLIVLIFRQLYIRLFKFPEAQR